MDYSKFPNSNRFYSGTDRKKSIIINNRYYFVKFQKKTNEGLWFCHISEYLGSHIFSSLGIDAQETFLGTYNDENVVNIADFLGEGEMFVSFNAIAESRIDSDKEDVQYTYDEIMKVLRECADLTDVPKAIELFWEMFIVDALVANFDRHGGNWGFIKKDGKYRLAPVFDNSSCLFPDLNSDEKMESVLNSHKEIERRIYEFPTSQIKYKGKKSSYYEIISSLEFEECNKALVRIVERMNMNHIMQKINYLYGISEVRREFYKTIIKQRYEKILLDPYNKLKSH